MKGLRDMWSSSNNVIRIVVFCALLVVVLAGLAYGLGIEWFIELLNQ